MYGCFYFVCLLEIYRRCAQSADPWVKNNIFPFTFMIFDCVPSVLQGFLNPGAPLAPLGLPRDPRAPGEAITIEKNKLHFFIKIH